MAIASTTGHMMGANAESLTAHQLLGAPTDAIGHCVGFKGDKARTWLKDPCELSCTELANWSHLGPGTYPEHNTDYAHNYPY